MSQGLGHSDLEAIEQFVVENDDLLELETLIGRFNIFDALGVARAEIRHSNFLAFILDPAESHGQSQFFLNAVLMDILKAAPITLRGLSPIELDGTDLRGVVVRREWNRIDLMISCRDPAFMVVIENKVDSDEHSDQLDRYEKVARGFIKENLPQARPMFVFLTPDGRPASKAGWISYSYRDLFRVLTRARSKFEAAIGDDVLLFLDHYLKLIGTRFMDDAKIDELCNRIWTNHRQALQLIFEKVGNPESGIMAEVESAVREDDQYHVFYRSGPQVDFAPKFWLDWLPPLGIDRKDSPESWIVFRFELYERSIDYYVEIRKMGDAALRKRLVDALVANGNKYGFVRKQARETTGSYTRVSSRKRILEFEEGELPSSEKIREQVGGQLEQIRLHSGELAVYLKSLLPRKN